MGKRPVTGAGWEYVRCTIDGNEGLLKGALSAFRSPPQPASGYPRSVMSTYPKPPPSYSPPKPLYGSTEESQEPLLDGRRSPSPGTSTGGYYNQPRFGDVPDDFKVSCRNDFSVLLPTNSPDLQYGVTVNESSSEIRSAFVRKVYTILCMLNLCPT